MGEPGRRSFPRPGGPAAGQGAAFLGTEEGARAVSIGGAIRLSAEIPIRVLSILATLLLTRRLGVLGFGEFIATLGVALVLSELADLGLGQSLIPNVVSGRRNVRDIFVAKARLAAGMTVVGGLAVAAVSAWTPLDPITIAFCIVHFVGSSWIECAGGALRAHGRRFSEAALLLVFRLVLVGLIGLTPLGATPRGVGIAYALAVAPGLLLGAILVARYCSAPRTASSWVVLREALPLGVNSALARLNSRIELFVLRALDIATGLGLFAASLRIVESLLSLPAALGGGALPALARETSAPHTSTGAAQRTIGLITWAAIPAAVGLSIKAPEILELLGPGFADGAGILRVFSLTLVLCFLNTALFHILVAGARGRVIPELTALRVGVGVILALVLIPAFGGVGGALGYAAAELVLFGRLVLVARESAQFSIRRPVIAAAVASLPMALALWTGPRPLALAVPLAVGAFAVGAVLVIRSRPQAAGLG